MIEELKVPPLASYGISAQHIPELVAKAAQASSMKGNPIGLTAQEMAQVLERAL